MADRHRLDQGWRGHLVCIPLHPNEFFCSCEARAIHANTLAHYMSYQDTRQQAQPLSPTLICRAMILHAGFCYNQRNSEHSPCPVRKRCAQYNIFEHLK